MKGTKEREIVNMLVRRMNFARKCWVKSHDTLRNSVKATNVPISLTHYVIAEAQARSAYFEAVNAFEVARRIYYGVE